jgi:hypothetical protein
MADFGQHLPRQGFWRDDGQFLHPKIILELIGSEVNDYINIFVYCYKVILLAPNLLFMPQWQLTFALCFKLTKGNH